MPRLTKAVPRYSHHKATGQAVVSIDGKDFYLGRYNSKASRIEYDRIVGQWQANGRRMPLQSSDTTVIEVLSAYWKWAVDYYRKDGKPTDTPYEIKQAVRLLKERYGHTRATDFGPLALKALQAHLVGAGLSRRSVNGRVQWIRRIFRWAVSEEMIPPAVLQGLETVEGLRKGRTTAPDHAPIQPIPEADVQAVLPHLPAIVSDMVRLQRLTGCRPDEVCSLRPCDVNRGGEVWEYRPASHKTQHHGRERIIYIGPKAQTILRPYLLRAAESYCFSPTEAESARRAEQHANRKTPLGYGNRPGTNRKRNPKRSAGERYTTDSYRRAVHRACDKAFPPNPELSAEQKRLWQRNHRWGVNRLRHSAATEIRAKFGLEAAQVLLGHASADVTQVYAERDAELARTVIRQIG
jgi:integrase